MRVDRRIPFEYASVGEEIYESGTLEKVGYSKISGYVWSLIRLLGLKKQTNKQTNKQTKTYFASIPIESWHTAAVESTKLIITCSIV